MPREPVQDLLLEPLALGDGSWLGCGLGRLLRLRVFAKAPIFGSQAAGLGHRQ